MTGARFPTSFASMASGAPALIFASPGVTSRATRSGNSVSDAASAACCAGPRATYSAAASATIAAAA